MLNDTPLVHIDLSPEYKQNLRTLSKRYRNVRSDTQELLEQIQLGNFIGDRIVGLGEDYLVIKARVKNSNIQKGKKRWLLRNLPSGVTYPCAVANHLYEIRSR
jgi:mRNA-degrading endonuclease RelE of RelBE toxin-antitoxin system